MYCSCAYPVENPVIMYKRLMKKRLVVMILGENVQFMSLVKLPEYQLDWAKIVDILFLSYFLATNLFYASVSMLIYQL